MILVDEPNWPWRGERWAHLVSDHSYTELHQFAVALGLRRLSFQGDHYDLPAPLWARALERGAIHVPARELVARLRAAGLRRAGGGVRWTRVWSLPPPHRFDEAAAAEALAAFARADAALAERWREPLRALAAPALELAGRGADALVAPTQAAFAFDAAGPPLTALSEIGAEGYLTARDGSHTVEVVIGRG